MRDDGEEAWDFYFRGLEGHPASIAVRLSLEAEAPDPARPTLLCVRLRMHQPNEHGLGTSQELGSLSALEDALAAAMRAHGDAVQVGRVTIAGWCDLCFYAADERALAPALAEAAAAVPGYELQPRVEDDPEWAFYTEFLLPDGRERQWMHDRRVVEQLLEHGDDGAAPRTVDFHVILPSGEARLRFCTAAAELGFALAGAEETRDDAGETLYGARLTRTDPVTLEHIHEVVCTLGEFAARHGGELEGWGTQVTTASRS